MAQCIHCKEDCAYNSHTHGTNAYKRHIAKCTKKPKTNIGEVMINVEGKLQAKKIYHMGFRDMVAMTIIQHDLPFSYIEYERVRSVWKYLNANAKFISRNTVAADVYKFYENETEMLKREKDDLPGRICFTAYLWTAMIQEGYMCLNAHYVDSNWRLNNKILTFCALPPPHSGMHLAMELLDALEIWGIEKKVFSFTLDNASNNDSMQEIFKSQLGLRNDFLCKREFFHVRCSAHILNLIVQDGLKVIDDSLDKIRDSIKYVKASESREQLFERCVETVGLEVKSGLILDVKTRWNSTYHMLDRAIKYRAAFSNLNVIDSRNYKSLRNEDEWQRVKDMCDFFEPFDKITRLMSGATYPTSNLYFMQVWKIQSWLKDNEFNRDVIIREMVINMTEKFQKYWEEYSDVLAMASVFDPMLKLTIAEYCFSKLDQSSCEEKLVHLRGKLHVLFEAYESKSSSVSILQRRVKQFETNVFVSGKSSLEMYLEEPPLDFGTFASLDILQFGKITLNAMENWF